jgi:hypothetical protein
MGTARILFKSNLFMLCERGDSLDDKEAADALWKEVIRKRGTNDPFILCEDGGGFDADEVIGVTVPQKVEGGTEVPEEAP